LYSSQFVLGSFKSSLFFNQNVLAGNLQAVELSSSSFSLSSNSIVMFSSEDILFFPFLDKKKFGESISLLSLFT